MQAAEQYLREHDGLTGIDDVSMQTVHAGHHRHGQDLDAHIAFVLEAMRGMTTTKLYTLPWPARADG